MGDVPPPLQEGTTHTYERSFSHEDVHQWAEISGDQQDRHFEEDEEGRLLLHGLLTASLQTRIGGDLQVLASRMDLHYRRPVYTGQQIHRRGGGNKIGRGRHRPAGRLRP